MWISTSKTQIFSFFQVLNRFVGIHHHLKIDLLPNKRSHRQSKSTNRFWCLFSKVGVINWSPDSVGPLGYLWHKTKITITQREVCLTPVSLTLPMPLCRARLLHRSGPEPEARGLWESTAEHRSGPKIAPSFAEFINHPTSSTITASSKIASYVKKTSQI